MKKYGKVLVYDGYVGNIIDMKVLSISLLLEI